MTGLMWTHTIHLPGTLAANAGGVIALPLQGARLVAVAACGANANDARLTLGTADDPDGILVAGAIGDSSTPVVFTEQQFDGALADPLKLSAPHFVKHTVLTWALDFDGAGGAAAANVDLELFFLEG